MTSTPAGAPAEPVAPPWRGQLAQRANVAGIEDLDVSGTADRMRDLTGRIRAMEAERQALIAHWADLHAPEPEADLSGNKDVTTGVRYLPSGPPGMRVSEFAAPTLGAVIGSGSWTAGAQINDALNLRHRHPVLQRLVLAGKVPVWAGRRVASATERAGLTDEDALMIDQRTASDFMRLPFNRAMDILEAELLKAPSSTIAEQQAEAQRKTYVRANRSNDAGMKVIVAQLNTAGAIRFDAMVTFFADRLLEMGDTRPVDVRRAAAFLLLADPAKACLLLAGCVPGSEVLTTAEASGNETEPGTAPTNGATFVASDASHLDDSEPTPDPKHTAEEPGGPGAYDTWDFRPDRTWPFTFPRQVDIFSEPVESGESDTAFVVAAAKAVGEAIHQLGTKLGSKLWDRLRPRSMIYLHGWHDPGGVSPMGPVVRGEGVDCPLLPDTVRAWLQHEHVEVRPVIDTHHHLAADSYEVPAHIREAVRLRHPFEQFPFGRQAAATCDLDHLIPYEPGGPRGQSSTTNLQPLGRRHHRTKTHSSWQVHAVKEGEGLRVGSLWRAPTGHWFLVDHLGTHDLGRPLGIPA